MFLIIGLVGLVVFSLSYPLRGKNIFLKNYNSNVLVFMTIERFLKSQNLSPQNHSLLHYKVDIFSFLTVVLIIYFSASESFLKIELVIRQKIFSLYPLRGKFIFLKFYRSDILVLMMIEKNLIIELVGLVIPLPISLRGYYIFIF